MITYCKFNSNSYIIKLNNEYLSKTQLINLISLQEYHKLIDKFNIYPKKIDIIKENKLYLDFCLLSKNQNEIKNAIDYINSILILNKMEEH